MTWRGKQFGRRDTRGAALRSAALDRTRAPAHLLGAAPKLHEAVAETHVIEEENGTVTLTSGVLAEVIARSVEEVNGARLHRRRRGLEIDVSDGRARVALELTVHYGEVLPDVAGEVQRRVADRLASMCGLAVDAVDVSVEELERA